MILIDSSQIVIAASIQVLSRTDPEDSRLAGAIEHSVWSTLKAYQSKFGDMYGELVVCCDGKRPWRKEIFPYYKYKRSEKRDESSTDWDNIYDIKHSIEKSLDKYSPWKVVKVKNAEGDDVIYHLAKREKGKHLIVSSDHDLQQSGVDQWDPRDKKIIDRPYSLIEHIIFGDAGDKVPNIINRADCYHTGLKKVVMSPKRKVALKKCFAKKGLRVKRLREYEKDNGLPKNEIVDRAALNNRLVNLKYTPDHLKDEIFRQFDATKKFSEKRLKKYFLHMKLFKHSKDTESFKIKFSKGMF